MSGAGCPWADISTTIARRSFTGSFAVLVIRCNHMLPFRGTVDVAYQPTDMIVGLSKLARLVEHTAKRPQVQERLTQQIAAYLVEHLAPAGVGVLVRAEHLCMTVRGAQAPGTETITTALFGTLRSDAALRDEFMHIRTGQR
ncbi:GTP cyclohydrolase I [Micromonospora rosaria]|uniref:GTP cyclohydrolase I n=1 Tax=Micromonospora rosaria TaxID=47874 RepID=UPI0009FF3F92|nr:GTP cyclohydrolase I [Micromonospora rosaria]